MLDVSNFQIYYDEELKEYRCYDAINDVTWKCATIGELISKIENSLFEFDDEFVN